MKRSTKGLLVLLFCFFGIIGLSQEKALKGREALYLILGSGGAFGLFLMITGRRHSRRKKTMPTLVTEGPAGAVKAVISRSQDYIVRVRKADRYSVPTECCSCFRPTERIWPIAHWGGSFRYSIDFRCCDTCSKKKFQWWTYRTPASFHYDPRSGEMVFGFCNQQFAAEFARKNGGKLL